MSTNGFLESLNLSLGDVNREVPPNEDSCKREESLQNCCLPTDTAGMQQDNSLEKNDVRLDKEVERSSDDSFSPPHDGKTSKRHRAKPSVSVTAQQVHGLYETLKEQSSGTRPSSQQLIPQSSHENTLENLARQCNWVHNTTFRFAVWIGFKVHTLMGANNWGLKRVCKELKKRQFFPHFDPSFTALQDRVGAFLLVQKYPLLIHLSSPPTDFRALRSWMEAIEIYANEEWQDPTKPHDSSPDKLERWILGDTQE